MKNKLLVIIISLICSVFFVGKVDAKEISQFCDYTEPCLTTQKVNSWIENSGIDTTVYDSYYITVVPYFNDYYFSIVFYKHQDMLNKNIMINESSYFTHLRFNTSHYRYTNTLSNTQKFSLSDVNIAYYSTSYSLMFKGATSSDTEQVILAYYSNKDILDNNGNIILKANIEIEDEQQEEPITIINKIALFVNDIMIYFNENNISFYQILIGLFIFNFLVYVICYLVRKF